MTDQEIISSIRKGDTKTAIKELYSEYPKVRVHVLSEGGDEEIARQLFHDGLLLLIEKVSEMSFELTSKLSTYLYGICHFLWKNELRKRRRNPEKSWNDMLVVSAEEAGYNEEEEVKLKQLGEVLSKVSEKCKKIFELFYLRKKNMTEIAEELEFSSVNSAKTQKYKCMERAIEIGKKVVHEYQSEL